MHLGSGAVAWIEAQSQSASTQILDKHKQFQHCWARYTVTLSLAKNTDIQKSFPSPLKAWFPGFLSITPICPQEQNQSRNSKNLKEVQN